MHAYSPCYFVLVSEYSAGQSSPNVSWKGVGLTVDTLWGHVSYGTSKGIALQ